MIKYRKLKNLLIWKCKQKKVGSQLPTATRMAELEEVEPPVPLVLLPCTSCNRTFRPEALAKHAKVCEKTLMKKRKKFDSSKQRLQGTDVPVFPAPPKSKETPYKPIPQSKWREKQAELAKSLSSVRKKSDGHVSVAVKPSDHEQCPYCERHFGPKAYDRHTEWCKEQHTKLKNSNNLNNEARERLQVRTKYRAPLSNRLLTRDKYLPRSRDPSPMSLSRLEVSEPAKQKLPSPLNRTSSLRMSGRSKSMIHKSPAASSPVELRDTKVRNHQSTISVREVPGKHREVQPKEYERSSIINGTENAKPKIVSSNQNPKKVPELAKERCHPLRKCRSWMSPVVLEPLPPSMQVDELRAYSCILHPVPGKRSLDSEPTDGEKRSTSVSKSYDFLHRTYSIERNAHEDGDPPLAKVDDLVVDVVEDLPQREEDDDEGDDTGEMISDNILHQSDSWKHFPLVMVSLNTPDELVLHQKPLHKPISVFHALPTNEIRKMICAPPICKGKEMVEPVNDVEYEVMENEIGSLNAAADEFLEWYHNVESKSLPNPYHRKECDRSDLSTSQFSFDENQESLFADLQMFLENSSASESSYNRSSNYECFAPHTHFVKIGGIVEIHDIGTTVDDLEDFINCQLKENVSSSDLGSPNDTEDVSRAPKVDTPQVYPLYENVSVQTAMLQRYDEFDGDGAELLENSGTRTIDSESLGSSLSDDDQKSTRPPSGTIVQEQCADQSVFIVNSKGSLKTYSEPIVDHHHASYPLSDSNDDSIASFPFSFLNIPVNCEDESIHGETYNLVNVSPIETPSTKSQAFEANETDVNGAGDFALLPNEKIEFSKAVSPSLNDIIALIMDVKKRTQLFNANDKLDLLDNLVNCPEVTNSVYCNDKPRSESVDIETKCEYVQVDLPCPKCNERDTKLAVVLEGKPDKTSWKTIAFESADDSPNKDPNERISEKKEKRCSTAVLRVNSVMDRSELTDTFSTDSLQSSGEYSDWNLSESGHSACSYVRKKTVKYCETIEYRENSKGASTVKTTLQSLPPLKNPPKMIVAKTVKKEFRPLNAHAEKEVFRRNRNSPLSGSREYLKLPPIKGRFERRPCLDRPSPASPTSKQHHNGSGSPKTYGDEQDSKALVPLSIDSAYGSLTRASSGDGDTCKVEPSKFCHECGTKYPVPLAKFCCNCGIRRITI